MRKEIDVEESLNIARNIVYYYLYMSSKRILNFIGISSLSGFIVYSIVKTEPLLLLNTLLLLFSGIYLALSYRMLRQAYISDKIFWSARDRIFIRTFLLAGYAVLLLLFYLSLHFTILSYLTFFLVATYLVFMSVNMVYLKDYKEKRHASARLVPCRRSTLSISTLYAFVCSWNGDCITML